ncbi:SDR family NAD(P)-dependent oxidoreductase [Sphingomonas oligophenolica]
MSLQGKTAVVTGAGSGIGRAIAVRLARDNAAIAVWDLNGDGAAETARQITDAGGKAIGMVVDCADETAIKAAAAKVRAEFGPITILVNNAGMAPFTPYMEISNELWDKTIAVNLKGPHLCTREMIPDMLAAGWGRIINITSSSTQSGSFGQAHYVASKGGLLGLTKALALEYAPTGITVNMVPPGFIDTPMLRAAPIDAEAFAKTLPMKRIGQPEDIAAACAFLASEEAGYMTGQTISMNGGRYMGSA